MVPEAVEACLAGRRDRVRHHPITLCHHYPGSSHAVLLLGDVRPESRGFIAPLADAVAAAPAGPRSRPSRTRHRCRTRRRGFVPAGQQGHAARPPAQTSATAPSIATAAEVVPQGSDVIENTARARDGIYLRIMDGGISRLRRLRATASYEIALPFDGTIGAVYPYPARTARCCRWAAGSPPPHLRRRQPRPGGRYRHPHAAAIDVTPYEVKRSFAAARTAPSSLHPPLSQRPEARRPRADLDLCLRLLRRCAYTPAFAALAGADRRRRHRRLRQCARRRDTAVNGTRRGSSPTSRTPGAT